jgi:hypothetical protein
MRQIPQRARTRNMLATRDRIRIRYLTWRLRALLGLAAARGAFLGPRGGEFAAKNKQSRYCENDY